MNGNSNWIITIKKINKIRKKFTFSKMFLYVFMLLIVLFAALPLVFMVVTAFKPLDELFAFPPRFFVENPTLKNFSDLFIALGSSVVPFTRFIFNSIVVSSSTVFFTVIVSGMGAYGLVKLKVPKAGVIFAIVIAALMFSPHVTQIPTYLVVNKLGLINKYSALIIPKIAVAYNLFLMKQFAEQLPNAYLESARIDGANEWYIFWKIVMPQLTPAWSTLIVFSFVANWNDYFSPLIFTASQTMKTLPLALQTIAGGAGTASLGRAGALAAATFLMTVPTIVIFVMMQRKVIDTMVHSGIKE